MPGAGIAVVVENPGQGLGAVRGDQGDADQIAGADVPDPGDHRLHDPGDVPGREHGPVDLGRGRECLELSVQLAAIELNDAPSSSNSSRLLTDTRLPKSRCAIRRVPACSSTSGTMLAPDLVGDSEGDAMPATGHRHHGQEGRRELRRCGPSTSTFDWPRTRCQLEDAKTSSSTSGHVEGDVGEPRRVAPLSGTRNRPSGRVSSRRYCSSASSTPLDAGARRRRAEQNHARVVHNGDRGARRGHALIEGPPEKLGTHLADQCAADATSPIDTPQQ